MPCPKSKQTISPEDDIDVQLQADWEDIGGVGNMSPEDLEHIAVTMFGCPPSDPDPEDDDE